MTALPDRRADWSHWLDPDERVLWTAAPRVLPSFHWAAVMRFLIGLVFLLIGAGILLSWAAGTADEDSIPWQIAAFGLVFGTWMSIGEALYGFLRRRATRYALTDRRALILRKWIGTRLCYVPLTGSTPVEVDFGRVGTIWLGSRPTSQERAASGLSGNPAGGFAFSGIAEPDQVQRLIRQIQRGEA